MNKQGHHTCYHCGKGVSNPMFKRIPKVVIDLSAKNQTYDFPIAAHAECDKRAEAKAAKQLGLAS